MSTNYSCPIDQGTYPDFSQVPAEQHAAGHVFAQHLTQLTTYSATQIQNLTAFCVENRANMLAIVKVMEHAIFSRPAREKLVLFVLLDSIVKMAGEPFIWGFDQRIAITFDDAYDACFEERNAGELRKQMRDLLKGWKDVFRPEFTGDLHRLTREAEELEVDEMEYMFENFSWK